MLNAVAPPASTQLVLAMNCWRIVYVFCVDTTNSFCEQVCATLSDRTPSVSVTILFYLWAQNVVLFTACWALRTKFIYSQSRFQSFVMPKSCNEIEELIPYKTHPFRSQHE